MQTTCKVLFGLLLVLIPVRLRMQLAPVAYPPVYGDYTDVLLFAGDAVLIALILVWAAARGLARRRVSTGPWFLTIPLLGILLAGLVSTADSVAPLISGMHVVRLMLLFGFYLYIVNEIRTPQALQLPLALQVGLQAVIAVAQFLAQRSLGLQALGELLLDPGWFGVSIVWAPGQVALRAYGLSDHPNILGGSLALGLLFLVLTFPQTPQRARLPLAGTIALGFTALFVTFSRAAWLGFAVGALLAAALLAARRRWEELKGLSALAFCSLAVLLPFVIASLPFLGSRFSLSSRSPEAQAAGPASPEDRSLEERAALNEAANLLFTENALNGTGLGTFPVALLQKFPEFAYDYQPVHVILLDAAAETGIFGALAYFLSISLPWAALWAARRKRDLSPGLLAASAMLAAVTVIGFFDYYPWFLVPGRLWHWLVWGLWAAFFHVDGVEAS